MDLDPKTIEALTKVLEALINGVFGGGLALAIYNAVRLRKAKKAGISDVEHVAVVQTSPPQKITDPLIAHLRAELRRAQQVIKELREREARLEAHIWLGKPAPPPD